MARAPANHQARTKWRTTCRTRHEAGDTLSRSKILLIDLAAVFGFMDRQVVNLLEDADEMIVDSDRRKLLSQRIRRLWCVWLG